MASAPNPVLTSPMHVDLIDLIEQIRSRDLNACLSPRSAPRATPPMTSLRPGGTDLYTTAARQRLFCSVHGACSGLLVVSLALGRRRQKENNPTGSPQPDGTGAGYWGVGPVGPAVPNANVRFGKTVTLNLQVEKPQEADRSLRNGRRGCGLRSVCDSSCQCRWSPVVADTC